MIGHIHPHYNVHIIDCRAAAYGDGGVTQKYRYQRVLNANVSVDSHAGVSPGADVNHRFLLGGVF